MVKLLTQPSSQERRLAQAHYFGDQSTWINSHSKFTQRAKVFPNTNFLAGHWLLPNPLLVALPPCNTKTIATQSFGSGGEQYLEISVLELWYQPAGHNETSQGNWRPAGTNHPSLRSSWQEAILSIQDRSCAISRHPPLLHLPPHSSSYEDKRKKQVRH